MSQKIRKIATYLGGGILVLVLLIIIAGMFIDPPPSTNQQESTSKNSGDSRLDELRQRSEELDHLYDVRSPQFTTQTIEEDVFASVGQLSDFDNFVDNEKDESEFNNQDDLFLDESEGDTTNSIDSVANPDERLVSEIQSDSDHVISSSMESHTPSITELELQALREEMYASLTTLELQLSNDFENLRKNLDAEDASKVDQELQALRTEIRALETNHEQLLRTVTESVANDELSGRIDRLESQLQQQKRQASSPTPNVLRNLYRLERIQGNTAVLIGQNTGTRFTFGTGDSVAYGGTVSSIHGDAVTIRWPNTTVTLSVY